MADQTRSCPSEPPFVTASSPQQVLLVSISNQLLIYHAGDRKMDLDGHAIGEKRDQHVVALDESPWSSQQLDEHWVLSLRQRVQGASRRLRQAETKQPVTIFRVPRNIRESDAEAYEPRMVSIGPYHRGKQHLQAMEELKLSYLGDFLERNPDRSLDECLKKLKAVEARARRAYSEDPEMETNEFVEMLLLDGCFVLELFLKRGVDGAPGPYDDLISGTSWAVWLVLVDMLMLENQLPFFVLQLLYDTVPVKKSLAVLSSRCLAVEDSFLMNTQALSQCSEFHHLLHLFHCCVLLDAPKDCVEQRIHTEKKITYTKSILSQLWHRSSLSSLGKFSVMRRRRRRRPREPRGDSILCATKLREAGIKFKRKTNVTSFLDVTFRDGRIEIPQMGVFDVTKYLFRNIIAFEQCFPDAGNAVTTYAALMDCIIDTAADVALLHSSGVIVNVLGDDDAAARLFNKLCREVSADFEDTYLTDLVTAVNKHCGSKINRWRAKLNHNYFNNPWSIISLCGAIVLLFFTLVQTILSVLQYVRPGN